MLNSVAKYLWGSAEEESEKEAPKHPEGHKLLGSEHLEVPLEEQQMEDDWVLIGNTGKENSYPTAQHHHHHLQPHHQHHHPLLKNQQQSLLSAGDSLSQPCAEVELLDEAASLLHHVTDPCGQLPFPDCDNKSSSDQEDGADSGIRPSSPDSVFSACSGRSSATYHPRGVDSEAWVVAPPPCFTGSQCDNVCPPASDPLENLLIEHPSMSVYVSQAASLASSTPSDPYFQVTTSVLHISGSPIAPLDSPHIGNGDGENIPAAAVASHEEHASHPHGRDARRVAVDHQPQTTLEKLRSAQNSAQRRALAFTQRSVNRQKCRRQNHVHMKPKESTNRKNKQLHPSGFKSSRVSQRTISKKL